MLKNEINEILNNLRIMFPNASCELEYHNIYQLMIAVCLSQQTTDKAVNKITLKLFDKYPDIKQLSNANIDDVEQIIRPLGLYKNKSKNIVNLCKTLMNQYSGQIPKELSKLESLPGIGRKTASVILVEGFHLPAFPVDTHIERVSKRMGIVDEKANVKEVEETLKQLIDQTKWHQAHHLLLFMGRYHCFAKKPNCQNCFYLNNCKYDKKTS